MNTGLDPLHSYDTIEIIKTLISKLIDFFNSFSPFFQSLFYDLINFFAKFIVFSIIFSLAMFIVLIIYARRYQAIRKKMMSKILPTRGVDKKDFSVGAVENPKWKIVIRDIDSNDASKWKLAILEADIILNDLLDTLALPGESIGDKLKAVEESEFDHLNEAWEAHKIRNAIAHGGSDFLLTQREAKRVIELYKKVFTEFEII